MTIILTSRKGGVGKTTLAIALATHYSRRERTLLLDLDPQGDASTGLGVSGTGRHLADALAGRVPLAKAICRPDGITDVAVGGEALDEVSENVDPDAVRAALETVRGRGYERIIIDCPPSLSPLVVSAWRADPDGIAIVPVEGMQALRAVNRVKNGWEDANLAPGRLRIALNRFDRRRVLDRHVEVQARDMYGAAVLNTRVRATVVVGESAAWRQSVLTYAPAHPVSEDLQALAEEVGHG